MAVAARVLGWSAFAAVLGVGLAHALFGRSAGPNEVVGLSLFLGSVGGVIGAIAGAAGEIAAAQRRKSDW